MFTAFCQFYHICLLHTLCFLCTVCGGFRNQNKTALYKYLVCFARVFAHRVTFIQFTILQKLGINIKGVFHWLVTSDFKISSSSVPEVKSAPDKTETSFLFLFFLRQLFPTLLCTQDSLNGFTAADTDDCVWS